MKAEGNSNLKKKKNVLPVLALIFAFVFPLAGFILSIIALAKKKDKKGMSITALVLSIIVGIISIIVLAILIITAPYTLVMGLLLLFCGVVKSIDNSYAKTDSDKELTNYYCDSPIVSASYFYRDEDIDGFRYEEIPEEYLDLFVDTLNSLTISGSSTFNGDYYYGWNRGIKCTYEDGSYFMYDGEELVYYNSNGESTNSRFVFVRDHFWNTMDTFNKSIRNEEKTEIAVYGIVDYSDKNDFIYEMHDGFYISLNNKLYFYSDGTQELVFECDENLGPVINATDEYILFIQRSDKYEKIKKLDLNSGDIIEEVSYEIDKFKEAYFDGNNEYYFAYNSSEIMSLNVKEEVYNVRSFETYDYGVVSCYLPEGYYAHHKQDYRSKHLGRWLYFYKENDDGDELLTFHNKKSLELSMPDNYQYVEKGDSRYRIKTYRGEFLLEWEKDTISMSDKNRQYSFRYADTIYEDESNRIIGFNPDEQIVYLYSVENNTISMKNIEDSSETVIDVLEDYDKIEFEWEDSKLYLRCTKDENETFGGCYDFGEEDEPEEEPEEETIDEGDITVSPN